MSVISLTDEEAIKMMKGEDVEEKRKELKNYLKLVRKNRSFISAATEINLAVHKHLPDPKDDSVRMKYNEAVFKHITRMMDEDMAVNGKEGQWSCGFMGSRWCDFKFEDFYVRCAFYSKKFSKDWKYEKPYVLQFVFDKDE